MIRTILAGLTAVPLLTLGLGATPAAAAADPKFTIKSVELGDTSVTANGLALTPVDITVKAGYASDDAEDLTLSVDLERTGGTGELNWMLSLDLKRTAGTPRDGVWTGTLQVPSTANGTFRVDGVFPGKGMFAEMTPYAGPTLSVTGTHQPKFTSSSTPSPVPVGKGYKLSWRLTDSATSKPLPKVKVKVAYDNGCAEGGGRIAETDANGIVGTTTVPAGDNVLKCVYISTDTHPIAFGHDETKFLAGVSAVPSKTSAKVGTIVPVNGTVTGAPRCKVNLQRLYGASQWRTVGTSSIRSSGRFTLNAQPAYKGKIPYRVLMTPCYSYVAASSKSFTITGV